MDRIAILAKTQKRHEGKFEKGGLQQSPLLRERVKLRKLCVVTMLGIGGRTIDKLISFDLGKNSQDHPLYFLF